MLRLGQSYLDAARLPRVVQPFLQRLSMQTGETANLSALDGHGIVYLVRSNSPRVVSIGFHAGARLPAHVVSPGYVILSTLTKPKLDAWIGAHDFGRFTAQTITDVEQFRQSVLAGRQLGYWSADQFLNFGLCGLAVPLTGRKGTCQGALSMTFQREVYPGDSMLTKLLPALQDAARAMRELV